MAGQMDVSEKSSVVIEDVSTIFPTILISKTVVRGVSSNTEETFLAVDDWSLRGILNSTTTLLELGRVPFRKKNFDLVPVQIKKKRKLKNSGEFIKQIVAVLG